jgi:hypothetical protein
MIKKKRKFKEPTIYYRNFIALSFLGFVFIYSLIYTVLTPENELKDMFLNRDLIGNSRQRLSIVLEQFVLRNFGKKGFVILSSVLTSFFLDYAFKEINEFLRFKKKNKLYVSGLVDNLDDDLPRNLLIVDAFHYLKNFKRQRLLDRENKMALSTNKYYSDYLKKKQKSQQEKKEPH